MAAVAEGHGAVEKHLARLRAHLHQLRDGEFFQRRARAAEFRKIAFHDAAVDLRDEGLDLAGAVVFDLDLVEGIVGAAEAEGGEMGEVHAFCGGV